MDNPQDYEFRYAFPSTLSEYKKSGWEYAGEAGHYASSKAGYENVIFIKRKKKHAYL